MAATTAAAIRDVMRTAIKALTPTALAHEPFKPFREVIDVRDWCEAHPTAAFRQVSIRDTGRMDSPVVSSTVEEWCWALFEVVTAYPRDFRAGAKLNLSLDDVITRDAHQLERAIGVNGYQTLGADGTVASVEYEREPGAACVFSILRLRVGFWRSV